MSTIIWNFQRGLSSASAAITKIHRSKFLKMYPTKVVLKNGASITVRFHEPRQIITLPIDLNELTDDEKKLVLARRRPKTKVKAQEDELARFDSKKYLKFIKKK